MKYVFAFIAVAAAVAATHQLFLKLQEPRERVPKTPYEIRQEHEMHRRAVENTLKKYVH